MMAPHDDYLETVFTCVGDYNDPHLARRLDDIHNSLNDLLLTDKCKEHLILKKVEPWNSVRVTFKIPRAAALRLRELARHGDHSLQQLGILAVQIEGDQSISLTIAGKNNERAEVVFQTSNMPMADDVVAGPVPGPVPGPSRSLIPSPATTTSISDSIARQNIVDYLRQGTSIFDSVLLPSVSPSTVTTDCPSVYPPQPDVSMKPFSSSIHDSTNETIQSIPFQPPQHGQHPPQQQQPTRFSPTEMHRYFPATDHTLPKQPPHTGVPHSNLSMRANTGNFNVMPPPYSHAVMNSQRAPKMMTSAPLLVNLLQTDPGYASMNNIALNKLLPDNYASVTGVPEKKKRKRKQRDSKKKKDFVDDNPSMLPNDIHPSLDKRLSMGTGTTPTVDARLSMPAADPSPRMPFGHSAPFGQPPSSPSPSPHPSQQCASTMPPQSLPMSTLRHELKPNYLTNPDVRPHLKPPDSPPGVLINPYTGMMEPADHKSPRKSMSRTHSIVDNMYLNAMGVPRRGKDINTKLLLPGNVPLHRPPAGSQVFPDGSFISSSPSQQRVPLPGTTHSISANKPQSTASPQPQCYRYHQQPSSKPPSATVTATITNTYEFHLNSHAGKQQAPRSNPQPDTPSRTVTEFLDGRNNLYHPAVTLSSQVTTTSSLTREHSNVSHIRQHLGTKQSPLRSVDDSIGNSYDSGVRSQSEMTSVPHVDDSNQTAAYSIESHQPLPPNVIKSHPSSHTFVPSVCSCQIADRLSHPTMSTNRLPHSTTSGERLPYTTMSNRLPLSSRGHIQPVVSEHFQHTGVSAGRSPHVGMSNDRVPHPRMSNHERVSQHSSNEHRAAQSNKSVRARHTVTNDRVPQHGMASDRFLNAVNPTVLHERFAHSVPSRDHVPFTTTDRLTTCSTTSSDRVSYSTSSNHTFTTTSNDRVPPIPHPASAAHLPTPSATRHLPSASFHRSHSLTTKNSSTVLHWSSKESIASVSRGSSVSHDWNNSRKRSHGRDTLSHKHSRSVASVGSSVQTLAPGCPQSAEYSTKTFMNSEGLSEVMVCNSSVSSVVERPVDYHAVSSRVHAGDMLFARHPSATPESFPGNTKRQQNFSAMDTLSVLESIPQLPVKHSKVHHSPTNGDHFRTCSANYPHSADKSIPVYSSPIDDTRTLLNVNDSKVLSTHHRSPSLSDLYNFTLSGLKPPASSGHVVPPQTNGDYCIKTNVSLSQTRSHNVPTTTHNIDDTFADVYPTPLDKANIDELEQRLKEPESVTTSIKPESIDQAKSPNITSIYNRKSPISNAVVSASHNVFGPDLLLPRRLTESVQKLVKPLGDTSTPHARRNKCVSSPNSPHSASLQVPPFAASGYSPPDVGVKVPQRLTPRHQSPISSHHGGGVSVIEASQSVADASHDLRNIVDASHEFGNVIDPTRDVRGNIDASNDLSSVLDASHDLRNVMDTVAMLPDIQLSEDTIDRHPLPADILNDIDSIIATSHEFADLHNVHHSIGVCNSSVDDSIYRHEYKAGIQSTVAELLRSSNMTSSRTEFDSLINESPIIDKSTDNVSIKSPVEYKVVTSNVVSHSQSSSKVSEEQTVVESKAIVKHCDVPETPITTETSLVNCVDSNNLLLDTHTNVDVTPRSHNLHENDDTSSDTKSSETDVKKIDASKIHCTSTDITLAISTTQITDISTDKLYLTETIDGDLSDSYSSTLSDKILKRKLDENDDTSNDSITDVFTRQVRSIRGPKRRVSALDSLLCDKLAKSDADNVIVNDVSVTIDEVPRLRTRKTDVVVVKPMDIPDMLNCHDTDKSAPIFMNDIKSLTPSDTQNPDDRVETRSGQRRLRHSDKVIEKPVDKVMDKPAEKIVEKVVEKSVDKTILTSRNSRLKQPVPTVLTEPTSEVLETCKRATRSTKPKDIPVAAQVDSLLANKRRRTSSRDHR